MAQKKTKKFSASMKLILVIVLVVLAAAVIAVWHYRADQLATFHSLQSKITDLDNLQKENELQAINAVRLGDDAQRAKHQIDTFDLITSRTTLEKLQSEIAKDQVALGLAIAQKNAEEAAETALRSASPATAVVAGTQVLPILVYHKPPADFAAQMQALKAKGYTTVHMSDVATYLAGQAKPPAKPAVITFDDGFEVQQNVLPILRANGQKATLYLIEGGVLSRYCIGLLRNNVTCGDAYLSIPQVKQMLSSGLIEIGDHTVDHPNMASLSTADQQFQITTAKTFLTQTFGVPITTFAYPYGTYNATTLRLLAQDGFSTAVTTKPGIVQTDNQPLQLHRVRTTYDLP